ncbi:MAG: penicillin acylase family protein [Ferruginibacter sp.]
MKTARYILLYLFCFAYQSLTAQKFSPAEIIKWQQQAKQVTIIRDNWGIPHIYGKTDADAVFGLLYAQCEDDFKRVEMNYIEKLGRMSEIKGEEEWQNDLYIRLIIDSADAIKDYKESPVWLRKLLDAYAAGINYFLYKNSSVKPLLLNRFEPWYPLLWTDGSIGAISTGTITEEDVKDLFSGTDGSYKERSKDDEVMTAGSNGFAAGPSKTASGNAILYINPHVTFYFRPEVHMVSEEGLNAYGAVTWGQFFVYQGFNEHCGWMHTSSNVDVADMYGEKFVTKNNGLYYEYEKQLKPVIKKKISLSVKTAGGMNKKNVTAFYTGHGPVMAKWNGKYISVKSFNRSIKSLIQSWQRTKTTGFESFKKNMELCSNTSNNTVFADDKGNIAYWHGNFIPKRALQYNWGKPVDGTSSATEWQGLHTLNEIVHVYNPSSGFIQNCNSTPYTVAGTSSPEKKNYPPYMAPDGENFRGVNAARLLNNEKDITIDKMIAIGYNRKLAAFEILIPALINVFDKNIKPGDSLFAELADAIQILKQWDYTMDENSVAATLAIEWAEHLNNTLRKIYIEEGEKDQVEVTKTFAAAAGIDEMLLPLLATLHDLKQKQGDWKIKWGTLNRYQRISSNIKQPYNDSASSYPIGFAASTWGSLPSYVSRYAAGTNKRYGVSGNSFVSAVEFGEKIKARSLLAGGNSGYQQSPHFNDQLEMYTKGQFKDVLFYKEDILKHVERKYHPGE